MNILSAPFIEFIEIRYHIVIPKSQVIQNIPERGVLKSGREPVIKPV